MFKLLSFVVLTIGIFLFVFGVLLNDNTADTLHHGSEGTEQFSLLENESDVTANLTDKGTIDTTNTTEDDEANITAENTEPPTITGARDLEIRVGATVAYRDGVTAVDSNGKELTLAIDTKDVNTSVPGKYRVIYSATDADGQTTSVTITLSVIELTAISREDADKRVEDVYHQIISEGMSEREKARAIYDYAIHRIRYNSTRGREYDAAHVEVYNAIKSGRGDCYHYAVVSQFLLTRAGFDNQVITRVGGDTRHYWNLVFIDDGWYHFDATITLDSDLNERFLFDEPKAMSMTARNIGHIENYYVYDHSLHPAAAGCPLCAEE
ncbi:MAG: DUF5011 domain-containing protein [Lachnospiraceae bacterium]|jgi:transglutaminase/protease-like cytokinesis protein 3|nr:DUF5011 domain-containing protein [Lachnospiraceae bacterium]